MATSTIAKVNVAKEITGTGEYTLTWDNTVVTPVDNAVRVSRVGSIVAFVASIDTKVAINNGQNRDIGRLLVDGKPPIMGLTGSGYCEVSGVRKPAIGWISSPGTIRITNQSGADTPAGTRYTITMYQMY